MGRGERCEPTEIPPVPTEARGQDGLRCTAMGALAVESAREAASTLPRKPTSGAIRSFKGRQVSPGMRTTWAPRCWRLPMTHPKGVRLTPPEQQTSVLVGASGDAPVLGALSQGPGQLSPMGGWPKAPQGDKALGQRGLPPSRRQGPRPAMRPDPHVPGASAHPEWPFRCPVQGQGSFRSSGSFIPGPRTPGWLFWEPFFCRAARALLPPLPSALGRSPI